MANTFRKIYKKTGNSGSASDYQLVGNIGVNGVELDIMKGASSSVDGQIGLVPKPTAGSAERYLSANGTFKEIDGYEQLKTNVGDLSWLDTPTKKDLVTAVNDAYGAATKQWTRLHFYSFWNVNLEIWGCGYLRYFSIKGTPENQFDFGTKLTSYDDCKTISGYTEFFGVTDKSITFNTNGDIAVGGIPGWVKDVYFNIAGCFVASTYV